MQDHVGLKYRKAPRGRFPIFKSFTRLFSTDLMSYHCVCAVSPNPSRLRQLAGTLMVILENLDLKLRLAYLVFSDFEQEVKHFLVEVHSTFPVLRLYQLLYRLVTHMNSVPCRPPTRTSSNRMGKRIKRYSSVSAPRKNKTTGTTFSEVLQVHDNLVQQVVIADYQYQ